MDDIPDCGWIIGLPEGWVCAHTAVVRYCDILVNRTAGEDFAPWLPTEGTSNSDKVRRDARICAAFQSALLNGRLSGSIFDGNTLRPLPRAAFIYPRIMDSGLRNGSIELDPLWPDDWRAWNGCGWAFPKDQFNAWLSSDDAYQLDGLPPDTALNGEYLVPPLSIREPSPRRRVALSEAVSWIAFGLALDADRLRDAIRWDRLAHGDLREAQRKVAAAVETLLNAGADEKIVFYGRYENGPDGKDAATEKIEPHHLDDFRQFLIGTDKLEVGLGLKRWYTEQDQYRISVTKRADMFTNVTVVRDDLMRLFPAKTDNAKVLTFALPAALPDIGMVMGLEEALCWTAYGKPSFDTLVHQRPDGSLFFTDPDGVEIRTNAMGEMSPHIVAYLSASHAVCAALREGTLISYVAPLNGLPLSIARHYWNAVDPHNLDHIYRGMSPDELAIGCPVLLSRSQLDGWRAATNAAALLAQPSGGGTPQDETRVTGASDENAPVAAIQRTSIAPYSDQERLAWMAAQPVMAADTAFELYRKDARHCRMKRPEFRTEWKHVKGTKQGRQPKSQIAK